MGFLSLRWQALIAMTPILMLVNGALVLLSIDNRSIDHSDVPTLVWLVAPLAELVLSAGCMGEQIPAPASELKMP